jgi:hypothetical protein
MDAFKDSKGGFNMSFKRGAGRPSSYNKKYARQAYEAAKCGANEKEIASILGIDQTTLIRWKRSFEEFRQSICNGKNDYIFSAKRSLNRRAIGIRFQEVTKQKIEVERVNDKGELEKVPATLTKTVSKYIPPDVGACLSILKNNKSKEW